MAPPDDQPVDEELEEVIRLELLLLNPSVRRSRERVASMLHPDFGEIGSSGRRWDVTTALDALGEGAGEGAGEDQVAQTDELSGVRLADDVILVTYESHRPDRVTSRSSVWVRVGPAWLLRHHQGTAVGPQATDSHVGRIPDDGPEQR
jgi:ribonuclease HI